jgi:Sulfotransferase family
MSDRRPGFVIVGATKSATTWLQRSLQQDGKVFMPGPEIHYFSRHFERGPAWYGALFEAARADQILGEKSNSYLDHPEAPERLKAALPDARLIVQLRNPIERAYSDYCMLFRRGEVGADPERYLGGEGPLTERLCEGGLYFRHISRFLELFPREQLCVTLYDDLRMAPSSVLNRVRAHIGLEATDAGDRVLALRVKDKSSPHVPLLARRLLAPFKGLVQPVRDTAWFRATRALIARPVRYPELTQAIRTRLHAYYQEDVRALSDLIGRDLGFWLTGGIARP